MIKKQGEPFLVSYNEGLDVLILGKGIFASAKSTKAKRVAVSADKGI